jgi:glycogen debranching enzyme
MEVLGELAAELGIPAEAKQWSAESAALLECALAQCFTAQGTPLVRDFGGNVVENRSLLPYVAVILGRRLPDHIREHVVAVLKSDEFLTDWGYATESPHSPCYDSDGYWRGPIWAPSTMLILDGLADLGETALTKTVAERFSKLVQKSGCAENFDALTGAGLRDRAYTWTASAFLAMAHEYL